MKTVFFNSGWHIGSPKQPQEHIPSLFKRNTLLLSEIQGLLRI